MATSLVRAPVPAAVSPVFAFAMLMFCGPVIAFRSSLVHTSAVRILDNPIQKLTSPTALSVSTATALFPERDEVHPPLPSDLLVQYLSSQARMVVMGDLASCFELAYMLKVEGFQTYFVDVDDLPTSKSFKKYLEKELKNADAPWVFMDGRYIGGYKEVHEQFFATGGRLKEIYKKASVPIELPAPVEVAETSFFKGADVQLRKKGDEDDEGNANGPRIWPFF